VDLSDFGMIQKVNLKKLWCIFKWFSN